MNIKRSATAILAAAALTLAGSGAANAATHPNLPPHPDSISRGDNTDRIISPYNGRVVCDSHRITVNCWQQRPDGQWQDLLLFSYPLGPDWKIYPVWEDPEAALALLPPEVRSIADGLLQPLS